MARSQLRTAALLALGVGVCALAGPRPARAEPDRPRQVLDSSGRVQVVVRNANDCAPWQPEAVWGPGTTAAPIGYRCLPEMRGVRD